MNKLRKIFKTERPLIGMIHFMPLIGYKAYSGLSKVLNAALKDLKALESGGVDGVMIENNYDVPHKIFVDPETIVCMAYLTNEIIKRTKLPVGISVLWNDYKAALSIAKISGGKFIRIPVFVDDVSTQYGDVFGEAEKVIEYRKKIAATDILLFTDIHVKHSKLLSKYSLQESANRAIKKGSDGIIVTGKWTGDAPDLNNLILVKKEIKNFPIFIGSGATLDNLDDLTRYVDGIIVGTSLKAGKNNKKHVNIKGERERIDLEKVKRFVKRFKEV